ncbi:MAG: TolC family protein [Steroidobacteraceae bacterium]
MHGRANLRRAAARRVPCAVLLALAQLGAGCATYHPLPLPSAAHLATRLDQLDLTIPAVRGGAPAGRVDVSRPLEVNEIGLLAILNDPELRAQRGERSIAQATQRQTSLLPNPSVSINWEALMGGPGTQPNWSVSLTQDITSLITYHRRVRAARAQTAQVEANQLWAQWQVAQNARVLAMDAYWGDRAITLSSREQRLIESEASAVRRELAAGNVDYAALAPLLATQATLDQSLIALQVARENTWKELDALLGLAPGVRCAIAPPPAASPRADVESLIESLPRRRPDLVALQLGYHSADESLRAAILGQFPTLALGPIWEQDTTNIRSMGPTGTFDIPLFNRNQAQVAEARATRLMLRDQYQSRLDSAVAEVRALQALIARTRGDIARSHAAAQSSEQRARAARDAYRQGDLDQRSLTDFESAALERDLETVALQRTLGDAQVSLTVLLGIGLPQTTLIFPAAQGRRTP